jgi:CBS domain-containing protein
MKAREVMASDVAWVRSDTPIREIAKLLFDRRIGAVPVIDDIGTPIGMVSEGDLIGRADTERKTRGDWWLALLSQGERLGSDIVSNLRTPERVATDVMSRLVVTVSENAETDEIARLLASHHIKRVPVVSDGRLVGIVSRGDLLRELAQRQTVRHTVTTSEGFISGAIADLDQKFLPGKHPEEPQRPTSERSTGTEPLASEFRKLAAEFGHSQVAQKQQARDAALAQRHRKIAELIDQHISDESWRGVLHSARQAAEHGAKEFMVLRFPSELCSDGGRAINLADQAWPATLRGEAAEIYRRWENDLRPHGFHLSARILDFPRGMPGDVGLFLNWGT